MIIILINRTRQDCSSRITPGDSNHGSGSTRYAYMRRLHRSLVTATKSSWQVSALLTRGACCSTQGIFDDTARTLSLDAVGNPFESRATSDQPRSKKILQWSQEDNDSELLRMNGLDARHKPGSIPKVIHGHHMRLLFDSHSSELLALCGNTDVMVPAAARRDLGRPAAVSISIERKWYYLRTWISCS
jgi:hypothetical protein